MKLFIILAAVTWAQAAKLDKTYLPPRTAPGAGGSANFLQTPFATPSEYAAQNTFSRNGVSQNRNDFAQVGNEYSQNGNDFSQNGNGFSQNGNDYSQNGNGFSQNGNDRFNAFESRPERAQAAFERNAAILRQNNQNDGDSFSYAFETENGIYAEENGVAVNGVEAQGGYSYTGDDGQVYSIRYTADQNGFVPQGDHIPTAPPVPEEILKALEQNARDEAAGIYDDGTYNEAKYGNNDQYNNANTFNNFNNNDNYNNRNEFSGDDDSVVTTSALFRGSPATEEGLGASNSQEAAEQSFDRQASNQRGLNRFGSDNVNKAYLPPLVNQRRESPVFGTRNRQPSYNARNGYRY